MTFVVRQYRTIAPGQVRSRQCVFFNYGSS